MSQLQGYGAVVSITPHYLVVERDWLIAKAAGTRIDIPLREVIGLHVKQPSMLTNGWVQLCVGAPRPALGRREVDLLRDGRAAPSRGRWRTTSPTS